MDDLEAFFLFLGSRGYMPVDVIIERSYWWPWKNAPTFENAEPSKVGQGYLEFAHSLCSCNEILSLASGP